MAVRLFPFFILFTFYLDFLVIQHTIRSCIPFSFINKNNKLVSAVSLDFLCFLAWDVILLAAALPVLAD